MLVEETKIMSIGVIGLGRLGSALVRGLYREHRNGVIYGYNRTIAKGSILKTQCPDLQLCNSETEVLELSDTVFIWTKPQDAISIIEKNVDLIRKKQLLLVSCSLDVPLAHYTARWAECYPNINMAIGKGVTLIHYAPSLSDSDQILLTDILHQVGSVYPTSAEDMSFYSALSSCGPALYATMLEMLADMLVTQRGYDHEICRRMVQETVIGTMLLQEHDGIDASEIVHQVAHPGGSSEAGVGYLKSNLPEVYEKMLKAMKKW
jgi:pyrroline-5-carboxylate reductase